MTLELGLAKAIALIDSAVNFCIAILSKLCRTLFYFRLQSSSLTVVIVE